MRCAASSGTSPVASTCNCPLVPVTKDTMTTVLICDDHRLVREGLRQSVQTVPGVDRVDTAESGEEVLARWPSERPDLVLMDVSMPGLGGVETTRRLVRAHPEAKVVMLSGAADRDAVAMAISGGARGYLHKNVSRAELCATVATALAEQPQQRSAPAIERDATAPELTEREQQVPGEVVRLLAVLAVDDEPAHATWFEQGLEHLEVLEVGEDVLPLLRGERFELVLVVVELPGRVARVVGEGVERRVVAHVTTV